MGLTHAKKLLPVFISRTADMIRLRIAVREHSLIRVGAPQMLPTTPMIYTTRRVWGTGR
jgi:hypothetical protein